MVEVFKTNVGNRDHANLLIGVIQKAFSCYRANFDLDDCDKVLRIESTEQIYPDQIISLISYYGYWARVMEDEFSEPAAAHAIVLENIFNYQ